MVSATGQWPCIASKWFDLSPVKAEELITPSPVWQQSIVISMFVCLPVCPQAYLRNYKRKYKMPGKCSTSGARPPMPLSDGLSTRRCEILDPCLSPSCRGCWGRSLRCCDVHVGWSVCAEECALAFDGDVWRSSYCIHSAASTKCSQPLQGRRTDQGHTLLLSTVPRPRLTHAEIEKKISINFKDLDFSKLRIWHLVWHWHPELHNDILRKFGSKTANIKIKKTAVCPTDQKYFYGKVWDFAVRFDLRLTYHQQAGGEVCWLRTHPRNK